MNATELNQRCNCTFGVQGFERPQGNREMKVRRLIESLQLPDNSRILDVGCGTGRILEPFLKRHQLYGLDCSAGLISAARQKGYIANQCDVFNSEFPYAHQMFDLVFCGETIEHGVDTLDFLRKIHQVLKWDGHLVLTFPNIRTPISFLAMLANRPPMFAAHYRSLGHVRDFTTSVMRTALTETGFTVRKMIGVDFCINASPFGILPRLATRLPSWSSTVIVLATP